MNERIRKALQHPDKLGAGASKRKHLSPKEDTEAVMHEFKQGTLRSGSGEHVKNRKQAIAISLNEPKRFARIKKAMGK